MDLECDKMEYALNINEYQRHIIDVLVIYCHVQVTLKLMAYTTNIYCLIVSMSQEFRRGLVQEFWVRVPTEIGIIWRFDWNQRICSQDGLTHMTVDKRPLFLTTWASAYGCLNVLIIRQQTFPRKWPKIKEYKIEATMLLFFFVFVFVFFAAISTCHKFCFILVIRSITNSSLHSRESCLLKGGVPKDLIYKKPYSG